MNTEPPDDGLMTFVQRIAAKPRFFIVGKGKSGTTWLFHLFCAHPDAVMAAERKLIERSSRNPALLRPLLEDGFFMSWFNASNFGLAFPQQTGVRYELAKLAADYLLGKALQLRGENLEGIAGRAVIGEKIAVNNESDGDVILDNVRRIHPAAKILHIVRDPRDMAVSALFHRYRHYKQSGRWRLFTRHIEAVEQGRWGSPLGWLLVRISHLLEIRRWLRVVGAFHDKGGELYGDHYLLIRYEDLSRDTRTMVEKMLEFLDLPRNEAIVDSMLERASFETFSQGRSKGEQNLNSFYRKGVIGDWKNHIGRRENWLLCALLGDAMRKFGYSAK